MAHRARAARNLAAYIVASHAVASADQHAREAVLMGGVCVGRSSLGAEARSHRDDRLRCLALRLRALLHLACHRTEAVSAAAHTMEKPQYPIPASLLELKL